MVFVGLDNAFVSLNAACVGTLSFYLIAVLYKLTMHLNIIMRQLFSASAVYR